MRCTNGATRGKSPKSSAASAKVKAEDLGGVEPAPGDLEGLVVEAPTAAALARHLDVGQERHLDEDPPAALALRAAALLHVEREAARAVAAGARLAACARARCGSRPRSSGRSRARSAASCPIGVASTSRARAEVLARRRGRGSASKRRRSPASAAPDALVDHLAHERGLAGAGDARSRRRGGRAGSRRRARAGCGACAPSTSQHARAAPGREARRAPRAGARARARSASRRRAASAAGVPRATTRPPWRPPPGPRSTTRSARRIVVGVVLDDEQASCPRSRQVHERVEQPRVVARVQADRRLVEHVADAAQVAAELGGEADALRLAAGQRRRVAVEGQVAEAQPRRGSPRARGSRGGSGARHDARPGPRAAGPRARARSGRRAAPGARAGCAPDPHGARLRAQPRAAAVGTRLA